MPLNISSSEEVKRKIELDNDTLINNLKTKTPVEINTWVDTNINTLADFRKAFKVIFKILIYILKKQE